MLYLVHQSHRDLNTSIHALLCNLWDPRENGVVTATMPGHGLRGPEAVHDAAVPEEEHQTKLIFVGNLTEQTMAGMDADIYKVHQKFFLSQLAGQCAWVPSINDIHKIL